MSKESCTPRMLPYTGKDHPWAHWVIFYPTPFSEQRKRKFFANRGEAEEFKKILGISYSHYVSTGEQPLTIAERSELTSANLILQPYGISLVELSVKMSDWITELQNEFEESMDDAISNIIKSGFHSPAVVPLHETIDSYLCGIKERRSAAYFLSVKTHLNSFKMFMGLIDPNMDIKNVTKQNVLAWFDHYCSITPRTGLKREKPLSTVAKYNALRAIQIYFNVMKRKNFIGINPAIDVERPILENKEPEYYSPEEAAAILYATPKNSDLRLYCTLAMFGGFRLTELLRMRWKHINFEYNDVRVDASMSKTRFRRLVKLPDNMRLWLAPFSEKPHNPEDYILSWQKEMTAQMELENFFKRSKLLRKHNGFRHSAATYHYAKSRNSVVTSDQMGNSPAVLKQHYANLTTMAKANEFYSILPKD